MPGWTLIHTPGHTPGHVSFFRESDGTLLVGDAFCTTKPESFFAANFSQPAELHGPPSYFTSDWSAAKVSVRKLAALEPATVAPGHGKPLAGAEVSQALHKLADDFERIAVPEDVKSGSRRRDCSASRRLALGTTRPKGAASQGARRPLCLKKAS